MGYTIIYQRAFIRTTRGIIPTVLGGCSNVTTLRIDSAGRPREVRERSWHLLYRDRATIEMPPEKLLEWIEQHPVEPEHDLFKFRSNWVLGKQEKAWFEAGIKAACTVEEYLLRNPGRNIRCELTINKESEQKATEEDPVYFKTTEDLEKWIDGAREKIKEAEKEGSLEFAYMGIGFSGEEPLKAAKKVSGPVAVKEGNRYLVKYCKGESYEFSCNASKAIIFPSEEVAAKEMSFIISKVRFVSAASAERAQAEKPFVLYFDSGMKCGQYIYKLTRNRLYCCPSEKQAARYASRAAAMRAVTSVYTRYRTNSTLQIVNTKTGETESVPVHNAA